MWIEYPNLGWLRQINAYQNVYTSTTKWLCAVAARAFVINEHISRCAMRGIWFWGMVSVKGEILFDRLQKQNLLLNIYIQQFSNNKFRRSYFIYKRRVPKTTNGLSIRSYSVDSVCLGEI